MTHFLLYLNDQTCAPRSRPTPRALAPLATTAPACRYLPPAGEALAGELRAARAAGSHVRVVMVHENDATRGGCEFGLFFQTVRWARPQP